MSSAVAPDPSRTAAPGTPYKGLTPYGEEDAALFFGRDVWSDIVTDNIKAYRLTLLYGESGVGKSSMLRAGVEHRLRGQAIRNREADGSPGLAVVVFGAWRGDAEAALVAALDEAADEAGEANGHGRATEATLEAAIERCAERCGGRVFLILDQFEEYFVYHSAGHDGFDRALPHVLRRRELPLNVLISIREDAVARLDRFKSGIPNLFDNYLRLDHLDRAAAREAIERPLESVGGAGARIEPELVDAVLDEVQAGTLEVAQGGATRVDGSTREVETPYLQLVMTRLWAEESHAGSDIMRLSTLKSLGGAQGIVSTHLEDAMASLPTEQRDIAARAFRYLVTRSRSKIAHSVTDLADWTDVPAEEMGAVLERLCSGDTRILRPVGESSYEIYHDVLADAILAWRAAHEAARGVEEEKRLGEQAVRRRLARLGLAVGLLAFVVVVLLALLAYTERNRANQQRARAVGQGKIALSRELAARSIEKGRLDADLGIWLAVAAWDTARTDEAKAALRTVLRRPPVRPPRRLQTAGGPEAFADATYSPDGRRILTWGEEGPIELWDARSARRIATFRVSVTAVVGQPSVAFSGDGSRFMTADRSGARVWSATDGRLIRRVTMRGIGPGRRPVAGGRSAASPAVPIASGRTALNADGTLLAAPMQRGGIGVWSARSGRRIGTWGERRPFGDVEFAVGGDRLIATELRPKDRTRVTIWRLSGGPQLASLRIGSNEFPEISPDGRRAFVTSEAHRPRLLDVDTGRRVGRDISRLPKGVSATFAAKGPGLITAAGSTATLWNARTGKKVRVRRFGGQVDSVTPITKGTSALVLFGSGEMRLWRTDSGRSTLVTRARPRETVFSVAIRADALQAMTTSFPAKPALWDLTDVDSAALVLGGHSQLTDLAVARGRAIATGDAKGKIRVWDRASGRALGSAIAGKRAVVRVAFDSSGQRLVSADADGTATVWDVAGPRKLATFHAKRALTDVALDPSGQRIATADKAGFVVVWPAAGGAPLTVIRASRRPLLSVQFSPDGRTLLTAARRSARIWEVAGGRPVERLDGKKKFHFDCCFVPYKGATFSPDGSRVAMIGTDGGLRLWTADGTLLQELQADGRSIINHATFSPHGSLVAAGGDDGAVHLIDARTGAERGRLRSPPGTQIGRVSFSPDGTKVAAMDGSGSTQIWDVRSHEQLVRLQGRASFVLPRAVFSPDGTQIISSDGDTGVVLRPCIECLSPPQMVPLARAAAHRQLSHQELRDYLHQR